MCLNLEMAIGFSAWRFKPKECDPEVSLYELRAAGLSHSPLSQPGGLCVADADKAFLCLLVQCLEETLAGSLLTFEKSVSTFSLD